MITIIAGTFLGLVSGIVNANGYFPLGIILVLVFSFVSFIFSVYLAMGIGYLFPQVPVLRNRHELVSIKDNIGTHGSFFLGSGNIEQKLVYFFYRKSGSGFVADKVEDAIIYEDEEKNPYIVNYTSEFKNEIWNLIAVPVKDFPSEIHIPKGSIISNYKLDL